MAGKTRRVYGALPLTAKATGPDKPFEVSVQGSFDTLSEQRPIAAYLVIRNNLDVPLTVSPIDVIIPDSKSIELEEKSQPFTIPERSSVSKRIPLRPAQRSRRASRMSCST